uniref:Uncharacterized protein n=1 Tax=Trichogramma kaykai TaxID=54128 RepID=A0ABD2WQP7_9HYME
MSHNFSLTSDALPFTHTRAYYTHSHTFVSTVYKRCHCQRAFRRSLAGLASQRDRLTSARGTSPSTGRSLANYAYTRALRSLRPSSCCWWRGIHVRVSVSRFFSTALYTLENERLARLAAAAASSKSAKSVRRHLHSMHKLHSFITPRAVQNDASSYEGEDDRRPRRRMLARDRNKRAAAAARPAACFRGAYIKRRDCVRSSSSALSFGRAAFFGIPEKIRGLEEAHVAHRE